MSTIRHQGGKTETEATRYMIIIGVDPGDSMGLAIVHVVEREAHRAGVFQGSPTDGLVLLHAALEGADGEPVEIACERFTEAPSRQRKTAQPTAQKITGVVEHETKIRDVPLHMQSPAPAHAIASNAFLRAIGWYVTASEVGCPDADDVNMALRHVVLLLATRHATVFSRLAARAEIA